MSAANAPGVSRASMDFQFQQSDSGSRSGHSKSRKNISIEAQRKTAGPEAVAFWAAQNPAINVEMTLWNIDMTNDGAGGFRPSTMIADVVAYGDGREARVLNGVEAGECFATTFVHQLPWDYLEEDGTEYQARDESGRPKVTALGVPVMLPRYRIKPERWDEAMRYFSDCIEHDAGLLPDGQKAIHGYSINLDESRPHIQILADTFYETPTKKDPLKMTKGFSLAFGSHRSNRMVHGRNPATGEDLFNPDGSPKMVRESMSRKLERFHVEFKEFMVERGHEVALERDAERHNRKLSLPDYKELQILRTEVEAERAAVDEADLDLTIAEAELDQHQTVLADIALSAVVGAERTKTHAELAAEAIQREAEADAAKVRERAEAEEAAQMERGYRRGISKGRSEGRAVGRREAEEIVDAAQREAGQIRDTATADIEAERRRIEAEQDERERELSEQAVRVEAERAQIAAARAVVDAQITEAVVAMEHAREAVDGGGRSVDEIREMYERRPLGQKEGIEYVASRAQSLAGRADRIAEKARAAEEARKRYDDAIESIEVNKDQLPHLREQALEETTLPTKSGKRRSLADIADERARAKFLEKHGVEPNAKTMATTRGEAAARKAEIAAKLKGSMPSSSQSDRQSDGQRRGQRRGQSM